MERFIRRPSVLGLLASAVVLVLCAVAPGHANKGAQYLPNCQGVPIRAPRRIMFMCADGTMYASNIRWRQWGGYHAYGSGKLFLDDCNPNCAEGHFQPYELALVAYGKQTCPNGDIAYRSLKLSYSRIYKVAPYVIAGRKYTTRHGALQHDNRVIPCGP